VKLVRCAIYTRKSSDEGLEQSFNSLDAQREACAAYILSQASEGWTEVPASYDDGGLSGGTLERPALQRLLGDVRDGRIDIIVVYKVDRLTRSLLDFAKLVEAFDASSTSFVSVTQSFNTTTSMGRLTLNMLLSFAQFEREVTAERIRDKIAASKARGMWMGGIPPLGYKPDGRSLAVVEQHADIVRAIFQRYLALGNVRFLAEQLVTDGILSPPRSTATGKTIGGGPFTRGQLYLMLKCRTYLGEISHKDQIYPGLHDGIVDRELWDAVQAKLAAHVQGSRSGARAAAPSLLAGKLVDDAGEPLVPVHAAKPAMSKAEEGRVRYRYYVSRALHHGQSDIGLRVPAREIETAVTERVAALFDDPIELIATAWLSVPAADYALATARAQELAGRLRQRDRDLVGQLVSQVRVEQGRVVTTCGTAAIAAAMQLQVDPSAPASIMLTSDVRLTRSGRAMRLIHGTGAAVGSAPDRSLTRLLAQAHRYWKELKGGELDVVGLAAREGITCSYVTRVLRLAFLAPPVVDAILAGKQRAGVDAGALTGTGAVDSCWRVQQANLLPAQA
jgi:site-specific DNA recombinase